MHKLKLTLCSARPWWTSTPDNTNMPTAPSPADDDGFRRNALDPDRDARLARIRQFESSQRDENDRVPAWKRDLLEAPPIPGREATPPEAQRPELEHLKRWQGETPRPLGAVALDEEQHWSEARKQAVATAAAHFGSRAKWNDADLQGPFYTQPREIRW